MSDGVAVVGCSVGAVRTLETGGGGRRCGRRGESVVSMIPWLGLSVSVVGDRWAGSWKRRCEACLR